MSCPGHACGFLNSLLYTEADCPNFKTKIITLSQALFPRSIVCLTIIYCPKKLAQKLAPKKPGIWAHTGNVDCHLQDCCQAGEGVRHRQAKKPQSIPSTFQLPFSCLSISLVTINLWRFQSSDKVGSDSLGLFFNVFTER